MFFFLLTIFQIVNCLHEWTLGHLVKTPFTGDWYKSIYKAIICLIDKIEEHNYHGDKLKELLKGVAKGLQTMEG
jgi:hypothetical protein